MRRSKETVRQTTPSLPQRELLHYDLEHMAKINPTGEGEHFLVREFLRQHGSYSNTHDQITLTDHNVAGLQQAAVDQFEFDSTMHTIEKDDSLN